MSNSREAVDEPSVEVAEPNKDLDVPVRLRGVVFPLLDGLYPGRVHGDTLWGDHESQEFNTVLKEQAFLCVGVQLGFAKALKHALEVIPMGFLVPIGITRYS